MPWTWLVPRRTRRTACHSCRRTAPRSTPACRAAIPPLRLRARCCSSVARVPVRHTRHILVTVVFQLCLLTRLLTPSRLPPPSCVFTCPVGDVWVATQRVCRVNCAQCFASVLPASFLMELGTMVTRDGYESLSPQSVFSSAVYSLRKVRKQMLSKRTKGSKTSVTVLMQFVSCVPAEVGARLATHAGLCPLWGPFRPADTESGIPAWTTWVEELAQPGVPRAGGGSHAAPALSARFHRASERSGGRHAPAVSFQLTFVCTGSKGIRSHRWNPAPAAAAGRGAPRGGGCRRVCLVSCLDSGDHGVGHRRPGFFHAQRPSCSEGLSVPGGGPGCCSLLLCVTSSSARGAPLGSGLSQRWWFVGVCSLSS